MPELWDDKPTKPKRFLRLMVDHGEKELCIVDENGNRCPTGTLIRFFDNGTAVLCGGVDRTLASDAGIQLGVSGQLKIT